MSILRGNVQPLIPKKMLKRKDAECSETQKKLFSGGGPRGVRTLRTLHFPLNTSKILLLSSFLDQLTKLRYFGTVD